MTHQIPRQVHSLTGEVVAGLPPRPVMAPVSAPMWEYGKAVSIAGLILCAGALAAAAALGSVTVWVGIAGSLCAACLVMGLVELLKARIAERREERASEAYAARVADDPVLLRAWQDQPDQGRDQGLGFWRRVMSAQADLLPHAPTWIRDAHPEICSTALTAAPERWLWVRGHDHVRLDDPIVQTTLSILEHKRVHEESLTRDEWAELARMPHPLVTQRPEVVRALAALPLPPQASAFGAWQAFWRENAQFLGLPRKAEETCSPYHYALSATGILSAISRAENEPSSHRMTRAQVRQEGDRRAHRLECFRHVQQHLIDDDYASLPLYLLGPSALTILQSSGVPRIAAPIRIEGRASYASQTVDASSNAETDTLFEQQSARWAALGLRAVRDLEGIPGAHWNWSAAWQLAAEMIMQEATDLASGRRTIEETEVLSVASRLLIDLLQIRGQEQRTHLRAVPAIVLEQREVVGHLIEALYHCPARCWQLPETVSEGLAREALQAALTHAEAGGHTSPPDFLSRHPHLVEVWLDQFPQEIRTTNFWWPQHPARPTLIRRVVDQPELWTDIPEYARFANDLLAEMIPEGVFRSREVDAHARHGRRHTVLQVPDISRPQPGEQSAERIRDRVLRRCKDHWLAEQDAGRLTEERRQLLEEQAAFFARGDRRLSLEGLRAIWSAVQRDWLLDAVREEYDHHAHLLDHANLLDRTSTSHAAASSSATLLNDQDALQVAIRLGVLGEV